jgi:hypothetical protein
MVHIRHYRRFVKPPFRVFNPAPSGFDSRALFHGVLNVFFDNP